MTIDPFEGRFGQYRTIFESISNHETERFRKIERLNFNMQGVVNVDRPPLKPDTG